MNFSFSEIFYYWDVLKEYFNPVPIIWWGVLGALTGFVLTLVILLILRKKVLVNRRHWTLKVLAYSYLVFIPLWSGYNCMQWFALHGCQREIVKNIPVYLGEANSVFNLYLKDYVTEVISERYLKLTGHEIIDKTVDYATRIVSETFKANSSEEKAWKDKVSDFFFVKFIESDMAKNIVIDEIEKKIGKPLLMDKDLTRELLNVRVQDLLDDGFLDTILTKHVKKLFGGFKSNVLTLFLLLLLVPVGEIVLAHYLERKKQIPPPLPVNQ